MTEKKRKKEVGGMWLGPTHISTRNETIQKRKSNQNRKREKNVSTGEHKG